MSRRLALFPWALAALSALPSTTSEPRPGGEDRDAPSSCAWGDVDGDGRLELATVGVEGRLGLLMNRGDGRFEDVSERLGVAGVDDAAFAAWADYDQDGRLDLFVGARAGASRLFHNEGGVLVDMTAGSGLACEGAARSAEWLDHDGDGRLELFVATAQGNRLFRGLEGGFFERLELPDLAQGPASSEALPSPIGPGVPALPGARNAENGAHGSATFERDNGPTGHGSRIPIGPTPSISSATRLAGTSGCASSVRDQASPGTCIEASTTPTLGLLHPLSADLFVALDGDVGIGTTSPAAKLDVAGDARMTGTLSLAPLVDQALDVASGSIYKGGALFLHTKGGAGNAAVGRLALSSVTTGYRNTASGERALFSNTSGNRNTASGYRALTYNTTGRSNTAVGSGALFLNTTGNGNTASGNLALRSNTTGYDNTATGYKALYSNTTGISNTASGDEALFSNTTGDLNTASGNAALYANTTGTRNTAVGAGALKSNTIGANNTASGARALYSNTSGVSNTASGDQALFSNTTGTFNTASGFRALYFNSTGQRNTASGYAALRSNTTGIRNTASGFRALNDNTTGTYNTACGDRALVANTTGHRNVALGRNAGSALTTGNDNIAIGHVGVAAEGATIRLGTPGTHTRAFVAGIRGATTGAADAIPVLVDSAGQLGTISSSRRFKEEIRDMGDASARLLELRPVVFRYKPEVQAGERPLEFGLVAEEVAEILPELVVRDETGQPFTVKYHLLSSMLLNELEKLNRRLESERADHARELDELRARLAVLEARALPAQR